MKRDVQLLMGDEEKSSTLEAINELEKCLHVHMGWLGGSAHPPLARGCFPAQIPLGCPHRIPVRLQPRETGVGTDVPHLALQPGKIRADPGWLCPLITFACYFGEG